LRTSIALLATLLISTTALAQEPSRQLIVGDQDAAAAPADGRSRLSVEVTGNPSVGLRSYLEGVLAQVKQNWSESWPEAVGSGQVVIEFQVTRNGHTPKVKIVSSSVELALQKAAVAAIVKAIPLSPLPSEFEGDHLLLRVDFAYGSTRIER